MLVLLIIEYDLLASIYIVTIINKETFYIDEWEDLIYCTINTNNNLKVNVGGSKQKK